MDGRPKSINSLTQADPKDYTQEAYKAIRRMLFLSEIAPEQRLNSRKLAKKLGMSPTPVIQALKWLQFQGFVSHKPNRGYFLERITPEEVRSIYDLRRTIETANLSRVMERLDREQLDRLDAALEAHNSALEQGYSKRVLLADMEFHLILASISGDGICERLLRYLFEMLYLKYRTEILFTHPRNEFAAQHKVLLERLEAGDEDGARQTMSDHILSVRESVLESMQRNLEDEQLIL